MQILLIDCQYLCYRAWHSAKRESNVPMLLAVLENEAQNISQRFGSDRIVFAFDSELSKRRDMCPSYKAKRYENRTEEERLEHQEFCQQINHVRDNLLGRLGYANVFVKSGYEADDIIAKICQDLERKHDAVIYSADKDLWQCLKPNVVWCSPTTNQVVTQRSFAEEWGLAPHEWANVKALAGCSTDNVEGLEGIGEKTAALFLRGCLTTGKKAATINLKMEEILDRNLPLVKLPFDQMESFEIQPDDLTKAKRQVVMEELGVALPIKTERKRQGFALGRKSSE